MAQIVGTWAYTNVPQSQRVLVPARQLESVPADHVCVPLKNYSHTLAVMGEPDERGLFVCIGWIAIGRKSA